MAPARAEFLPLQVCALSTFVEQNCWLLSTACAVRVCYELQCMQPPHLSCVGNPCTLSGQDVLDARDWGDVDEFHWVLVLLGQIVVYRILFYIVLRNKWQIL